MTTFETPNRFTVRPTSISFEILVTPRPSIPQGMITDVSNMSRLGFTFNANPCVVIHRAEEMPTAAILFGPTHTPVLIESLCPSIPYSARV